MASAQVVETSVTYNSPSQDCTQPDDLFQSSHEVMFGQLKIWPDIFLIFDFVLHNSCSALQMKLPKWWANEKLADFIEIKIWNPIAIASVDQPLFRDS